MAAPNLKSPTTITGKTARYAVTTTLANALANSAASGKVFKINSIYMTNIDSVDSNGVSLTIYNGTTDFYIQISNLSPQSYGVYFTRDGYFYLEEGDSLRAVATNAGDIQLIIGYEEIS